MASFVWKTVGFEAAVDVDEAFAFNHRLVVVVGMLSVLIHDGKLLAFAKISGETSTFNSDSDARAHEVCVLAHIRNNSNQSV